MSIFQKSLFDLPNSIMTNNNNFMYTLDSEVNLHSVVFTDRNAIQIINSYSNTTSRKIKMSIY